MPNLLMRIDIDLTEISWWRPLIEKDMWPGESEVRRRHNSASGIVVLYLSFQRLQVSGKN
jgi:hypothetical protein